MSGLMDTIRGWFGKRTSGSGGGLLGEPGTTQRPGASSGGPGDGPATGGSAGPAGTQPGPDTRA